MTRFVSRRSVIVSLVVCALGLAATATPGAASPGARMSRHSLRVNDTGRLHLTRKSGPTLYESGSASGTLPGTMTAVFHTGLTRVTGSVTFHARGGSITMTAVGYPQSAGVTARFSGSIAVSGGTGRYRSALGHGTFSGTVNRRSWRVTVHAVAGVTY